MWKMFVRTKLLFLSYSSNICFRADNHILSNKESEILSNMPFILSLTNCSEFLHLPSQDALESKVSISVDIYEQMHKQGIFLLEQTTLLFFKSIVTNKRLGKRFFRAFRSFRVNTKPNL